MTIVTEVAYVSAIVCVNNNMILIIESDVTTEAGSVVNNCSRSPYFELFLFFAIVEVCVIVALIVVIIIIILCKLKQLNYEAKTHTTN